LDCAKKWAWRYICGIKQPQTDAMKIGSDTHDIVDKVYRYNTPITQNSKPAQMAKALITVLPQPNAWIFSESDYYIEVEHDGQTVYFVAKIDILDFLQEVVFDHKTTGNLKWAKTPDSLQFDLQAIIYSVIAKFLGMKNPSVQWTYVTKTGKPRTQLVRTKIENLEEKFKKVVELGLYVKYLRYSVLDYNRYPQVIEACGMYGGCWYKDRYCNIDAKSHIMSMWYQHERAKGT
jgi:hypothetical protein